MVNQYPEHIDLLFTDVIMPGMSGRDLAEAITTLRPRIEVLFMSGYTNDLIAQYGVLSPDTLLLEKPFTMYSLLSKVNQALHESAKAVSAS
jgi:FixJ family two-component response regulator